MTGKTYRKTVRKERRGAKKGTIKRLLSYFSKYRGILIFLIFCALVTSACSLAAPKLIGLLIDRFEIGESGKAVLKLFSMLGAVYFFGALSQWLLSAIAVRAVQFSMKRLRADAFKKVTELPLAFLDSTPSGRIISRFTNDIEGISEGLFQIVTQLFSGLFLIVGAVVMMLLENVPIALAIITVAPIALGAAAFISRRAYKIFRRQSRDYADYNAAINELVGNQKIVKAFNYEEREFERVEKINLRLQEVSKDAMFYSSITNPTTRLINNISYVLVGLIGGLIAAGAFAAGAITAGSLSAMLSYSVLFAKPLNEIGAITTQIQTALAGAERVFEYLDEPPQEDETGKPELPAACGDVEFRGVGFSYDKSRPLIKDFSLSVPAGSHVAIVGPTGAGKTTLVNLMMRFYDVDEGAIFIDGTDIQSVTRESVRANFGMVLQDSWLFSGKIYDNIAFGKPGSSKEEVIDAATAAYAHGFIMNTPDGYQSYVSEEGDNFSQGQKQLITIARAMIADPRILILDEATSSVDTRTEEYIQRALLRLMKDKTAFIIAHRLSTIVNSDLIIVMDKGAIVETGRHGELLAKGGFYAELYNSQFAGDAE